MALFDKFLKKDMQLEKDSQKDENSTSEEENSDNSDTSEKDEKKKEVVAEKKDLGNKIVEGIKKKLDGDDKSETNDSSEEEESTEKKKQKELIKEELKAPINQIITKFSHIIKPEEKTLSNYINPTFWLNKRRDYKKLTEKELESLNIYEVLSEGAKPTIEYYVLTILSGVIATMGLIQGSTATIIGAMIVAPLMTPILGFSLGVIWGDVFLIRRSVSSIFKGVLWAVIISAILAYIIPISQYSNEIISRTHPTFYDIIIAIASGIVGAYGYANKKISNTIVGIAIAVALMPPLCVIGISLGKFNADMAYGATLLFLINLVSIGLSGAVVFWIMKIHPALADQELVKKRALSQIVLSVIILMAISIPIGFFIYEGYTISEAKNSIISRIKKDMPEQEIFNFKAIKGDKSLSLNIFLTGEKSPEKEEVITIINEEKEKHPIIKEIKIRFIKSSYPEKETPPPVPIEK